jgi:hypothetical protein
MHDDLPTRFAVRLDDGRELRAFNHHDRITLAGSEGPFECEDFHVTSRVVSTREGRQCVRVRFYTPEVHTLDGGAFVERMAPIKGWAYLEDNLEITTGEMRPTPPETHEQNPWITSLWLAVGVYLVIISPVLILLLMAWNRP